MSTETRQRLKELVELYSLQFGDFVLSSGQHSSYYMDSKMTTLSPEGAYLVGKEVFDILKNTGIVAVGGPTIGADPIVAAVALISFMEGLPMPAFMVRKESKEHGTQKFIEGCLPCNKDGGSRVAIVEDVITTGASTLHTIRNVEAQGYKVVKVAALIDRNQGGSDKLREEGYDFSAILSCDSEGIITVL